MTLLDRLVNLLEFQGYAPHGACLVWSPPLLLTYVVSDGLIALSYYSIPFALFYFVHHRKDLAFRWVFVMFGIFIFACGTTHVMDILTIWRPLYWFDATLRQITSVASVSTAVVLWLLLPKALVLPSPAQLAAANRALQAEISAREATEREVTRLYEALQQRHDELEALNGALQAGIREREAAEAEVLRLNDTLKQRNDELEGLNSELESFSYSVSHDLRAPLRSMNGFSRILLEDYAEVLDEVGQAYLTRIKKSSERMSDLINDLLKLARFSRESLSPQTFDLAALAQELMAELLEDEPERVVDFACDAPLWVFADPPLLRIVLTNLLSNALKFTRRREVAHIRVGQTEAAFFVEDNGAGFSMAYAARLFGVFQRLHAQSDFEGTGVGLATVQRIIHRHGGRIWAEAEEDAGARFLFTLPEATQG